LIAISTEPPFTKSLFLDEDSENVKALSVRTAEYADRRVVERGDVNADLVDFMRQHIPRRAPCLCVLDPEGIKEIHWETIEALAAFGEGRLTELLILFNVDGLARILGLKDAVTWPGKLATQFFGNEQWREIAERKRRRELSIDEARTTFVRLYREGLEGLGYLTDSRDIQARSTRGRIKYILVFATGKQAGLNIMSDQFDRRFTGLQQQLFRLPRQDR
jgi:three-Cys-motif partner protein